MARKGMEHSMQECMRLCWECRDVCQDTLFNHILPRGGSHLDAENVRVMADCIEICQVAADFMRRRSPLHVLTCGACAEVCETCAESCEAMGAEHLAMQRCAEICRECAESCREMSAMKQAA